MKTKFDSKNMIVLLLSWIFTVYLNLENVIERCRYVRIVWIEINMLENELHDNESGSPKTTVAHL